MGEKSKDRQGTASLAAGTENRQEHDGEAAWRTRDPDRPPPRDDSESSDVLIGPYKVIMPVGEHGWCEDFLAEGEGSDRRKVLVEVINKGLDWKQVVSRFEAERPALARLDNPQIARLLDAGTRPSGQPYFVMEWVDGPPLPAYCDEQRLPLRERLELFVSACRPVQYAHTKGVIHGGLEPSRVRVVRRDDKPLPRVLGFGVAGAVGRKAAPDSPGAAARVLGDRPEYLSPEQADANVPDLDTRSDVYSLGVLLYELLTGTTPLSRERLRDASPAEALRLIREEEPPPPSKRVEELGDRQQSVAEERGARPKALVRDLKGELDCVALKALRKDRDRRYQTVHDLARDVERYLAGDPVEACPVGTWGRLRKEAGKHRWRAGLAAALLVLLAVVAAGGVAWRVRGSREADRARQAEGDAQAKRREAEKAEDRLKGEVRREKEGWKAAEEEREKAHAAAQDARRAEGRTKAILAFVKDQLLGASRSGESTLPEVFWNRDPNRTLRQAVDSAESKVGEAFANRPLEEAQVREMLGLAYLNLGEAPKAVKQYERALELREALQGVNQPATADCRNQLAVAYRHAGRTEDASRLFHQRPGSPDHAAALADRGMVLLAKKKPAEAGLKLRASLLVRQKVQPDAWTTFQTESLLGEALMKQGQYAEAEPLLLKGYEGMKQRQAQIPSESRHRLNQALERLVQLYDAWGKKDKAARWRKELEAAEAGKKS